MCLYAALAITFARDQGTQRHAIFRDFDTDVVPERIFEEIFTSLLDERFPESHWATKESFVRRVELKGSVHHFINRTWKVYNISVVTWCLQVPFLKRLLIPSPCNNFGCLSSQVSCGLADPRTAKPWRLSNQLEQSRRWRPESRVSMYLPFSVTILSCY